MTSNPTVLTCCRHCAQFRSLRYRGLCSTCYQSDAIRKQYPAQPGNAGRRGEKDDNRVRPLPDEPTDALPGTVAKMDVMSARIEAGYQPHHPLDARRDAA